MKLLTHPCTRARCPKDFYQPHYCDRSHRGKCLGMGGAKVSSNHVDELSIFDSNKFYDDKVEVER